MLSPGRNLGRCRCCHQPLGARNNCRSILTDLLTKASFHTRSRSCICIWWHFLSPNTIYTFYHGHYSYLFTRALLVNALVNSETLTSTYIQEGIAEYVQAGPHKGYKNWSREGILLIHELLQSQITHTLPITNPSISSFRIRLYAEISGITHIDILPLPRR